MQEAKALIVPAAFAFAGVRASAMLGATSSLTQIAAGIAGAALGLFIAKKIK